MAIDTSRPADAVVAAGRERLLTHGIEGLRALLNASTLAKEVPVSRDTAYRVFRGAAGRGSVTDAIVAAVGEAGHDMAWSGADAGLAEVVAAYLAEVEAGHDGVATVIGALRATVASQFRSPGQPVGWILHAAAITASPAWEGEPPADGCAELGEVILEQRRASYQRNTEQLAAMTSIAMSDLGRRPRSDIDIRVLVALVHALMDGAVLRRFIEPDALPNELIAEAMYRLAVAFSEQGPAADPRKPTDERHQQLFDRMLAAAAGLWAEGPAVTVDAAADRAGVSVDAASLLFPYLGDLADSLVRSQVMGGGLADLGPVTDAAQARRHLPGLVSGLGRLRDLADTLPHALAAGRDHPPTRSKPWDDDFVDHHARIVAALGESPSAERLVRDLVGFAGQGTPGWPSVTALLRTVRYDADEVSL